MTTSESNGGRTIAALAGVFVLALAGVAGCGDDESTDGAGGAGGATGTATGTGTGLAVDCTIDADCQVISDCCIGCVAASTNATTPECLADCFQDPCQGEYGPEPNGLMAVCSGGVCVLNATATGTATDTATGTATGTSTDTSTGTSTATGTFSTTCGVPGDCEIISDCCLGCISIEAGQTIPMCPQTCLVDACEGMYGQGAMLSTTCDNGMCGIQVQ